MKIKSLKFKSVNSTNDIALNLIQRNKFKPTLISAEQQIKAWQYLHDTGLAYELQGWFGRRAQQLIQEGVIYE